MVFYIRVSNDSCCSQNNGWICKNIEHPDYKPWKTCECSFEKCPLKSKCKPLTDEEKEIILDELRL